jgi:uncharacterized protein YdaU (DUF1376 family)
MHYYNYNIADYRKDTAHLKPIEHYIYRTLMDTYYLDELPVQDNIPSLLRRLNLPNDRSTDVQQVLNDFFILSNGQWMHPRIEQVIKAYHTTLKTASTAGKKSASIRKAKRDAEIERALNDGTTPLQPTNNQEPITKNQEPRKTKPKSSPSAPLDLLVPDWVKDVAIAKAASEFVDHRKAIKSPMTDKAVSLFWKELLGLSVAGHDVVRCIDKAILNGWKSVYPPQAEGRSRLTPAQQRAENNRKAGEEFVRGE